LGVFFFLGCYWVFLSGFGILILVGFVVLFLWVGFGCFYVYFLYTEECLYAFLIKISYPKKKKKSENKRKIKSENLNVSLKHIPKGGKEQKDKWKMKLQGRMTELKNINLLN
jgi:hypothetical protein